jgi:hydrogenase nickel incorporation protein HypA/HybF
MSIVDIAREQMQKHGARKVLGMTLEIGTLSGVVIDALEFALEEAVRGTELEEARREIDIVEGKAYCEDCMKDFHTADYITLCPVCNGFNTRLTHGKELRLKTMDIE